MVDERFTKINVKGGSDYSSLAAWDSDAQGVSTAIHIGVLSSSDTIEKEFNDFVDRKMYNYMPCDFIFVTEAGEMLASYIDGQWEVHASDIRQTFLQPVQDPDRYRNVAHHFIQQRFGDPDDNYDLTETQVILQETVHKLAELVARNPRAIDELEWRECWRRYFAALVLVLN